MKRGEDSAAAKLSGALSRKAIFGTARGKGPLAVEGIEPLSHFVTAPLSREPRITFIPEEGGGLAVGRVLKIIVDFFNEK